MIDESSLERILPHKGYIDGGMGGNSSSRAGASSSQPGPFDIMNYGNEPQQPTNFVRMYNENSLQMSENFEPISFDVDRLPGDESSSFDTERLGLNDFDTNSGDAERMRLQLKKKHPMSSTRSPMAPASSSMDMLSDDSGSRNAESPRKRPRLNLNSAMTNASPSSPGEFRAIHHTPSTGGARRSSERIG